MSKELTWLETGNSMPPAYRQYECLVADGVRLIVWKNDVDPTFKAEVFVSTSVFAESQPDLDSAKHAAVEAFKQFADSIAEARRKLDA